MACNLKNKLKISVHVHRPHPSVPEFLIAGVPVNTPLKMICKHRIPSTPNDNTAEFHITLNFIQFFFLHWCPVQGLYSSQTAAASPGWATNVLERFCEHGSNHKAESEAIVRPPRRPQSLPALSHRDVCLAQSFVLTVGTAKCFMNWWHQSLGHKLQMFTEKSILPQPKTFVRFKSYAIIVNENTSRMRSPNRLINPSYFLTLGNCSQKCITQEDTEPKAHLQFIHVF